MQKRITIQEILRLLTDRREILLAKDFHLDEYFPSEVKRRVVSLRKIGKIDVIEEIDGWRIKINKEGKQELLKYDLGKYVVKTGNWDGKWRVVFFDIEEIDRKSRDRFRYYLKKLGMKLMLRSVWISPYDMSEEVVKIREMLNIPYDVRLGVLEEIENSDSLRRWFRI